MEKNTGNLGGYPPPFFPYTAGGDTRFTQNYTQLQINPEPAKRAEETAVRLLKKIRQAENNKNINKKEQYQKASASF